MVSSILQNLAVWRDKNNSGSIFENISIISFNYDRSFKYLTTAGLMTYYDVVGYSRLMGADEEGTLEKLKSVRAEFTDPLIAE